MLSLYNETNLERNVLLLFSTESDKSFEVWIKRCEEMMEGK